MWLADTSVKRPVFATMVILALVVLGVVSYPEIGVDLMPKVDFPIVSISTNLKGASPEVIDVDITDKRMRYLGNSVEPQVLNQLNTRMFLLGKGWSLGSFAAAARMQID